MPASVSPSTLTPTASIFPLTMPIRLPDDGDDVATSTYTHSRHWLRPKYIFFSLVVVYVIYCFVFDSPFFSSRLPRKFSGPHQVGTIDIEAPVERRIVDDAVYKDSGKPAFEVCRTHVIYSLHRLTAAD